MNGKIINEILTFKINDLIKFYDYNYKTKLIVSTKDKGTQIKLLKKLLVLKYKIKRDKIAVDNIENYIDLNFKTDLDCLNFFKSILMNKKINFLVQEVRENSYLKKDVEIFKTNEEFSMNDFLKILKNINCQYVKLPFEFSEKDYSLVNKLKYIFQNVKCDNKCFVIDTYENIEDYLFYYICFKNNNVKLGVEIKRVTDFFEVIEFKKRKKIKCFDCLILDLKSMYGVNDFNYFNKIILKEIRLIRDLISKKKNNLIIKMNGYEEMDHFERLKRSGFNKLYIE